jgi:hypothetical protein
MTAEGLVLAQGAGGDLNGEMRGRLAGGGAAQAIKR